MAAAIPAAAAQHHGALTMLHRIATQFIMQRLRIALEWCRNPDHLPLIAVPGRLRAGGWEIDLVIVDDHCDGLQALAPVCRGAAMWRDLHTRGGDVVG
jgi:hypothetical protein